MYVGLAVLDGEDSGTSLDRMNTAPPLNDQKRAICIVESQ
jgi:hypothetical protein